MSDYHSILVAVDLTAESRQLVSGALKVAAKGAQLHLVHVAEHPVTGLGGLTGKNHRVNENQIRQSIFPELQALAQLAGTGVDHLHILFGDAADEISALAHKLQSQLIVTGSHGRRGIQRLLGTTATQVLHSAPCDVLTIRIQN